MFSNCHEEDTASLVVKNQDDICVLRIVEVNGVNVNQENHKQVVTRIKSMENETKLLGGNTDH